MTIIYLDMDGVLVDFERGIREQFNLTNEFLEGLNVSSKLLTEEQKIKKRSVYDLILAKKEYWENLPMMDDGLRLWEAVVRYQPIILTAAPKHNTGVNGPMFKQAAAGKFKWVNENLTLFDPNDKFGEHNFICTTSAQKKDFIHTRAGVHQILIDDRPRNIMDWNAAGGRGILHTSTAITLGELDDILGS